MVALVLATLIGETVPRVIVQGPPLWSSLLTPIVSAVGIIAAYFFGRRQGKAQTRHEKSVEAVVQALRIVRLLQEDFGVWALYEKRDALELDYAGKISDQLHELQQLIYDSSPWFEPTTEDRMDSVYKASRRYYQEHTDALKSGDADRIKKSGKQLSEWLDDRMVLMVNALEDESRRLIGTKRHWRYTWRGRFGAWVRRNTVWLLILLILLVILVGIRVCLLVAG